MVGRVRRNTIDAAYHLALHHNNNHKSPEEHPNHLASDPYPYYHSTIGQKDHDEESEMEGGFLQRVRRNTLDILHLASPHSPHHHHGSSPPNSPNKKHVAFGGGAEDHVVEGHTIQEKVDEEYEEEVEEEVEVETPAEDPNTVIKSTESQKKEVEL